MFDPQQIALVLSKIEEVSKRTHCQDGDDIENDDYYCPADNGNFDDAFVNGIEVGEIGFARDLLAMLTSDS